MNEQVSPKQSYEPPVLTAVGPATLLTQGGPGDRQDGCSQTQGGDFGVGDPQCS